MDFTKSDEIKVYHKNFNVSYILSFSSPRGEGAGGEVTKKPGLSDRVQTANP